MEATKDIPCGAELAYDYFGSNEPVHDNLDDYTPKRVCRKKAVTKEAIAVDASIRKSVSNHELVTKVAFFTRKHSRCVG